ncbi:hypothetical protein ACFO0S_04465 [Chryseomicrobium palamuruense]|uniref:Type II toxin-antitoxin system Phd/YefM family antitoxin n=1 Tax=Chryseomicrobium palamuruense TaxID=682973 RepID=A0ABV8UU29_9BACL
MSVYTMRSKKPMFTNEQLTNAGTAAKKFGSIRKKAKEEPQYIMDNGSVDTVVLDYSYYEEMYGRLIELEEAEEARVLTERLARLDANPESAISWKSLRKDE